MARISKEILPIKNIVITTGKWSSKSGGHVYTVKATTKGRIIGEVMIHTSIDKDYDVNEVLGGAKAEVEAGAGELLRGVLNAKKVFQKSEQ